MDTLTLRGRYGAVSERTDYSPPMRAVALPGYGALSVEAAWAFRPDAAARLVIDNLFGDHHEDAVGFPSPGHRARLQLSRDF